MSDELLKKLEQQMQEEAVDRLEHEDEELRAISPATGALGLNNSDYRNMYDIFMNVVQPALAIKDSGGFLDGHGTYDTNLIKAYTALMNTALKALAELNKMRNQDRMTAALLDEQTKAFAQEASVALATDLAALRNELGAGDLDSAEDGVVDVGLLTARLDHLLKIKLPEIFLKSAVSTLAEVKETYGLLN